MRSSELYDRGAQPERTLLAWGRTCLASSVVLALVVKVLAVEADAALILLTVAGLSLPVLAWLLALARYRRVHRELTSPGAASSRPGGGAAMAAATAAALLCAALALVLIVR